MDHLVSICKVLTDDEIYRKNCEFGIFSRCIRGYKSALWCETSASAKYFGYQFDLGQICNPHSHFILVTCL